MNVKFLCVLGKKGLSRLSQWRDECHRLVVYFVVVDDLEINNGNNLLSYQDIVNSCHRKLCWKTCHS